MIALLVKHFVIKQHKFKFAFLPCFKEWGTTTEDDCAKENSFVSFQYLAPLTQNEDCGDLL